MRFSKTTTGKLDYQVNWASWLDEGDTISTSTFTVPAGLTLVSDTNTDTTATAVISGGTNGKSYEITNTITTTPGGRITERTFYIDVRVKTQ